jgi:hypothetical protein
VAFPDGDGAVYNCQMASRRLNEPIEPMTLGNMRCFNAVGFTFTPSTALGSISSKASFLNSPARSCAPHPRRIQTGDRLMAAVDHLNGEHDGATFGAVSRTAVQRFRAIYQSESPTGKRSISDRASGRCDCSRAASHDCGDRRGSPKLHAESVKPPLSTTAPTAIVGGAPCGAAIAGD